MNRYGAFPSSPSFTKTSRCALIDVALEKMRG